MLNNKLQILPQSSVIGIFGGGQLGRMSCFAAHDLGYRTIIFSDVKDSPASFVSNKTIVANYNDEGALNEFINEVDIATFEFENIPVSSIDFVSKNKPIYPNSNVLRITQNRLHEKDFLSKNGIIVANYKAVLSEKDMNNALSEIKNKAILKTATMGYDGKGQFVLDKNSNTKSIWQQVKADMILEEFVDFEQEISVIAARSVNKQSICYEPLTNIHKNGILDKSIYPAKIKKSVAKKAQEIALKIIDDLDLIGLIAVEFFVLKDGNLLVNELAPRPHNSGHFSMDACITNQFEQFIRAITGFSLGSVEFHSKGFMKNIIGNEINDIEQYMLNDKAKLHIYGKNEVKEGRKMAHVNILQVNKNLTSSFQAN